MDRGEKMSIVEEVERKHPYLDESKLPITQGKEEILAEIKKLEDAILKKKFMVRTMHDKLKEIDLEINRWDNKRKLMDSFNQEFSDYEKSQQDEILKIREARKESAMDALIKQKMSDELRKNLGGLMQNYGRLMEEPLEVVKAKSAAVIGEDTADIIANIREKLKETEKKEEKPKEEKKEAGVEK